MTLLKYVVIFLFVSLTIQDTMQGQSSNDSLRLHIDLPIMDFGYQSLAVKTTGDIFSSFANPSMKQSLGASNGFYSSAHWGIKKLFDKQSEFKRILFSNGLAMVFDLLATRTPFGNSWLHEEYHRAVLTRREINSFNDMNTFPFGSNVIAVRKVLDEDLIKLSNEFNPDFRRAMVAGNEATYQQIQSLQKKQFLL